MNTEDLGMTTSSGVRQRLSREGSAARYFEQNGTFVRPDNWGINESAGEAEFSRYLLENMNNGMFFYLQKQYNKVEFGLTTMRVTVTVAAIIFIIEHVRRWFGF
jgi:hypothetical protein